MIKNVKKTEATTDQPNFTNTNPSVQQIESETPKAKNRGDEVKGKDLFHQRYVEHFQQPTLTGTIASSEEAETIFNNLEILQGEFSKVFFNNLSSNDCRKLLTYLHSIKNSNQMVIIASKKQENKSDLQHILTVYNETLEAHQKSLNAVLTHILEKGESPLDSKLANTRIRAIATTIGKLVVTTSAMAFVWIKLLHELNDYFLSGKEEMLGTITKILAATILLAAGLYCLNLIYKIINACCCNDPSFTPLKQKQS